MEEYKDSLKNVIAFDAHDWSSNKNMAWIYGVVMGWGDAIQDVADKHKWSEKTVNRLKMLHNEFNQDN